MKIGIDGRLYYETGVGRYIRNLISHLQVIDKDNHYVVFLPEKAYRDVEFANDRWEKRKTSIPWHSVSEQTSFIPQILQEQIDLMHFPYFSFPIFYPKPFIVTIHDLIIDHFDTGRATTKSVFNYKLRRFGYLLNTRVGLRRAAHIITVSNATKSEIVDHIGIEQGKISVIYEGVDEQLLKPKKNAKSPVDKPYFLYVGNAYPHKNLEMAITAFAEFCKSSKNSKVYLVLVGKKDYFYTRLEDYAKNAGVSDRVTFFGDANDSTLQSLYSHAIALVAPSRMEGFGLPILEALANNCSVLASDISVFRELFGDHIVYFDPNSSDNLTQLFQIGLNPPKSWQSKKQKARVRAHTFSWEKTATKTLQVYNKSLLA